MTLDFKKRKRSILEKIFTYPSFNLRFGISLGTILFLSIIAIVLVITRASSWSNKLIFLGLLLQGITLIFGIVATYFALQQLTESRHSKLEEIGGKDLREKRYFSAMSSWREALYIKPTSSIFLNLMETYIISGELKDFDELVKYLEKKRSFQQKTITEPKDYVIFCYLRIIRSLFVENIGVAKEHISEMVKFIREEEFVASLGWSFEDIKGGQAYKKLIGDHKKITNNLILYLEKALSVKDVTSFENGDYLLDNALSENTIASN